MVNVTHTLQGESDCITSHWTCALHEGQCIRAPFTWFGAVVWVNIYVVATDYDSCVAKGVCMCIYRLRAMYRVFVYTM